MRFALPWCLVLATTTIAVTGAPARAAAPGTATSAGGVVTFAAVAGQANQITVRIAGTALVLDDIHPITAGAGCLAVAGDGTTVRCAGATKLTLDLGDGNDLFSSTLAAGVVVHGGPGNDRLTGGDGPDSLYGDAGDDYLDGRAGDDWLYGGDGDDELHGGLGADELDGGPGRNILDGGN
ncbi:calcium-binding protein [Catenuloplanes japonicus]|uniref:calcium-binding protein n=1 Tax=Catenuloplanes japonicus TaxID=33876 RepID=UPI00068A5FC8|nr:hypothetical protein [Catenuloplanes japonicus]